MSDKAYTVTLKDTFNATQCLDARKRISETPGVSSVWAMPQGCFGIDMHRLIVNIEAGSDAVKTIRQMPEVGKVSKLRTGPNPG